MSRLAWIFWVAAALVLALGAVARSWEKAGTGLAYTVRPGVALRSGPDAGSAARAEVGLNTTLDLLGERGAWLLVRTPQGREGWVRAEAVSSVWIKVHKRERRLYLMRGWEALRSWPVALSPGNPLGDKERRGDQATPEGRFFVCERLENPGAARYGARSLRLSYPEAEDARRGLRAGLIDYAAYRRILAALERGAMPPQDTALGGSLRIHGSGGGGAGRDWTLGCVALDDADVRELFALTPDRVRVEIYKSATDEADKAARARPEALAARVLQGCARQLASPSLYTAEAAGYIPLAYPGGDVPAGQGVCTDVLVRAARAAGLDLQALVHEDVLRAPRAYRDQVGRPNRSIDHRRARVLRVWFGRHARLVYAPGHGTLADVAPGDVLFMDTGIANGTPIDHVGLALAERDAQGLPLVCNNWAPGLRTAAMDLVGNDYPTVVAAYRLVPEW